MVFPGLAIDTLHVAVVPLMVIEADGVAACTDVACAVAEQDNNRINARMREIVFFFNIQIGLVAFTTSIDHTKHVFYSESQVGYLPQHIPDYNMPAMLRNMIPCCWELKLN